MSTEKGMEELLPKDADERMDSIQMELFRSFVSNKRDDSDSSNSIRIWETIPKYFPVSVVKKCVQKDSIKPYEWPYGKNGEQFSVIIKPAMIQDKSGNLKPHWPGTTEEFIEEILKKFLSEQQLAIHNPTNLETWVRFSLSMIKKEMEAQGCTRSFAEIKKAITIMSECNINVLKNNSSVWSGSILQELVTVGRKEYEEDSNLLHSARLPVFISQSINNLDYRQFNYPRYMLCKNALTRWIYKQLIHKYTYADYTQSYNFSYSTLYESGLLQQKNETENRKKVIASLKELISMNMLSRYTDKLVYDKVRKSKIIDVIYDVWAGRELVREQKASLKARKDRQARGENCGIKHQKSLEL